MGLSVDEFVKIHPNLFHMAEPDTWANIQTYGLLSTSKVLDGVRLSSDQRSSIESENRRKSIQITHPKLGAITIRDQIPMTDTALKKCLQDMSIEEWYRKLNSRVFFWTTAERLSRLFGARAYRGKIQTIITIDTKSFLDQYANSVELSPINSGSTIYNPQPRGSFTFLPMDKFPFEEWRRKRNSKSKAVVEVTVPVEVPNLRDFVLKVEHVRENNVLEVLFVR